MKLQISLTGEKASICGPTVRIYRERGSIHALELDFPIGKLRFSQTSLFGKFGRKKMRGLYKKLYRLFYISKLSPRELNFLRRRGAFLTGIQPRMHRGLQRFPAWVLFTDAAATTNLIASVLCRGGPPRGSPIHLSTVANVPHAWLTRFHSRNKIYGSDLPPLAFLWVNLAFFRKPQRQPLYGQQQLYIP